VHDGETEGCAEPMSNLLWLAIPLAALLIGIVWAYFASRPSRPAAMQDSMESFSRFRHALAQHSAGGRRTARGSAARVNSTPGEGEPAVRSK